MQIRYFIQNKNVAANLERKMEDLNLLKRGFELFKSEDKEEEEEEEEEEEKEEEIM